MVRFHGLKSQHLVCVCPAQNATCSCWEIVRCTLQLCCVLFVCVGGGSVSVGVYVGVFLCVWVGVCVCVCACLCGV
jgi:hypothetical protein